MLHKVAVATDVNIQPSPIEKVVHPVPWRQVGNPTNNFKSGYLKCVTITLSI